jgi:CPA1 family monovalent cation:H+ antiporter
MDNLSIIIFLLFAITFLAVLSNKYRFPFSIVLVLCGVAISLVPALPTIQLNPNIVFLIFLPPMLYRASWNASWHEFRTSYRPITLAAIGLVLLTTALVAVAAHSLIPDFSWPIAFLIGAIVSPPDAVAAISIVKGLGLSPRIIAILEGESLFNDASGLIAYKYALLTILAGNFVFWEAGLNFFLIAVAGIAIGLVTGYLMYIIHKKFICNPVIEVTLTLLTPFAAYMLAEHFHFSGILAVVTTGLFLSYRSASMLSNQSRIMTYAVWEVVNFVLNGLIFIFIGLQLRDVMLGIREYQPGKLLLYGVSISLVVILARFIWIIPALLFPHRFGKKSRTREKMDPKELVIFGWSGMRGVVSMAAALAIPIELANGAPFPHRSLLIFLTFCVILSTLVVLGLTLPWMIKVLKIKPHSIVAEEYLIRTEVVKAVIDHIEANLSLVPEELLRNIKSKYEVKFNRLQKTELPATYFGSGKILPGNIFNEYSRMQIDLIGLERQTLVTMHRNGQTSEEIIRKIEYELDLEEARLQMEMVH